MTMMDIINIIRQKDLKHKTNIIKTTFHRFINELRSI